MPANQKPLPTARYHPIPKEILEKFQQEPRIVWDISTHGLMLIDPGLLTEELRVLSRDYDIVAVPKTASAIG